MLNLGNKNTEQKCLDIVKECSAVGSFAQSVKALIMDEYTQEERPDFLFGSGEMGLEHFLTDVIFGVKRKSVQSIERKNSSSITEKINYYHENPRELDNDISNGKAPKFVEDIINSEINGVSKFAYSSFISNFMKVFEEHYANRNTYRSKCKKLGFLVELPYPNTNHYVVTKNGHVFKQCIKTLPLTKDMLDFIQLHVDLDFLILCIRPIHFSGSKKECRAIYIDPRDVYKSVSEQGVFVCDLFDYPHKFLKEDIVKLEVK